MAWNGITAGDFGFIGRLVITQNGVPVDISSYTTREYFLTDPDGNVSSAKTAAFDTDGEDGALTYTFQDGDIDEGGRWKVRARLKKTGAQLTSQPYAFRVYP